MLTRRVFLKSSGMSLLTLGTGALLGGPRFLHRAARAAVEPEANHRRRVLVCLFQRGAMDGLMAVPPLDEEGRLRRYRPRLALASPTQRSGAGGLLDLGNGFGLHPAFEPLMPLWRDGRLGIVHAVGSPDPTRSHFDAQDYMETGTPGRKGTASGWLNRVSGLLGHEATPFRAVALTRALPRSLYGAEPALAVSNLADFRLRLPGGQNVAEAAGKGFEALYEQTSGELLRDTGEDTFEAMDMLSRLQERRNYPTAAGERYPRSELGSSLRQIAFLVKSQVGLEVAFAESGGWDTHVQQGTLNGTFANRARDLAASIAAFWHDLGSYRDDVVLLTMTEFGRTARENGSGGTDHGHGSCLFVLGNQVEGGRVHGELPSLDPDALYEGRDLPVTTDFRSVFTEVAGHQLGIRQDSSIFPGWDGPRLPLFRA